MDNRLIPLQVLCSHYEIEDLFIRKLEEFGLITIIRQEDEDCLSEECIGEVESMMRLHYDLNVNYEGIDVIYNMLVRMKEMQKEISRLRNQVNAREL